MGFKSPNFTQVPNDFWEILPEMGEAEARVVFVLLRQTFGFGRDNCNYSIRALARDSGLSQPGVLKGLAEAETRGLIRKISNGNKTNGWEVIIDPPENQEQSEGAKRSLARVLNVVEHRVQRSLALSGLNKDKDNKEKGGAEFHSATPLSETIIQSTTLEKGGDILTPPAPALEQEDPLAGLFEDTPAGSPEVIQGKETKEDKRAARNPQRQHAAIKLYRSMMHLHVPDIWVDDVVRTVGDGPEKLEKWGSLMKSWVGRRYNKGNVEGLLDAFRNGGLKNGNGYRPEAEGITKIMVRHDVNGNPISE